MVDDKCGSNKLLIGLGIGIVLVCLMAVVSYIVLFSGALNASSAEEHQLKLIPAGNVMVTEDQLMLTKGVLLSRFTEYGYQVTINTLHDDQGTPYLRVKYGDIPSDIVTSVVTTPGVFEMRIQTHGNESEHILYGDGVEVVSVPTSEGLSNGSEIWGVSFGLTRDGATKFQQACIDTGATKDPADHSVIMLLDDKVIYERPISPDLANEIRTKPIDTIAAMFGAGNDGKDLAKKVSVCLRGGAMPVKMEIATS